MTYQLRSKSQTIYKAKQNCLAKVMHVFLTQNETIDSPNFLMQIEINKSTFKHKTLFLLKPHVSKNI